VLFLCSGRGSDVPTCRAPRGELEFERRVQLDYQARPLAWTHGRLAGPAPLRVVCSLRRSGSTRRDVLASTRSIGLGEARGAVSKLGPASCERRLPVHVPRARSVGRRRALVQSKPGAEQGWDEQAEDGQQESPRARGAGSQLPLCSGH
jgi:hypothetical protein